MPTGQTQVRMAKPIRRQCPLFSLSQCRSRSMFLLKCSVLALLAVHLSASSASPSAQRPFGSSKGTNTPGVGFEEVDCSTWKLDIKPPLRCFFFETPLHYNNAADNRTARLAVLHYPAGAGKTPREQVQGSLFLNQGGPGVSGVQFLIESAEKYDKLVTNGAYDLIGWDVSGTHPFLLWSFQ